MHAHILIVDDEQGLDVWFFETYDQALNEVRRFTESWWADDDGMIWSVGKKAQDMDEDALHELWMAYNYAFEIESRDIVIEKSSPEIEWKPSLSDFPQGMKVWSKSDRERGIDYSWEGRQGLDGAHAWDDLGPFTSTPPAPKEEA